jgi:hypothetical protein
MSQFTWFYNVNLKHARLTFGFKLVHLIDDKKNRVLQNFFFVLIYQS